MNQQYAWLKKLGVIYLFDKYLPKHFGKNMYIAKKWIWMSQQGWIIA